jgi:hypothetical protein
MEADSLTRTEKSKIKEMQWRERRKWQDTKCYDHKEIRA